jgi:light-regulated signal transduction histidine kinase (bacteriophytochrome)
MGKSVMTFVPEVDSHGQDLTTLLRDIVADPGRYVAHVIENVCKDGRRVWMSWTHRAIVDDQNRVAEVLSLGNDISAQKQAEDQLRRARDELQCAVEERTAALTAINTALQEEVGERAATEKALARKAEELARSNGDLEQFAYAASHDLHEPLRNVSSCVQLLRNRYGKDLTPEANQLMKLAEDSTDRMKNLINGLLRYSRVGTRGNPFEPRDCEQVLKDTLSDLRQAIEDSAATVTHDPLPTVLVDGTQLAQVFQNLIGNALKFCVAKPPQIHISAKRDAEEWIFSVKDNGIGIEAEYTDKIFAVFKRLHGDSTYPGTGIGLAITKKIVERHGGRIWVESEPHVGSTFYFTLPATTGGETGGADGSTQQGHPDPPG